MCPKVSLPVSWTPGHPCTPQPAAFLYLIPVSHPLLLASTCKRGPSDTCGKARGRGGLVVVLFTPDLVTTKTWLKMECLVFRLSQNVPVNMVVSKHGARNCHGIGDLEGRQGCRCHAGRSLAVSHTQKLAPWEPGRMQTPGGRLPWPPAREQWMR